MSYSQRKCQVLQAFHLNFTNLSDEQIDIKIDYDEDIKKVLKYLKGMN